MAQIKLKANCKVNLFLDVLNKREDGYHNIETVFQEVSLADDLLIKEAKSGIKVVCSGVKGLSGKGNIAYKAAELLKNETGVKKGAEIRIKKRIPLGAGLGGGSSDAAAVLKALNILWKTGLSKAELKYIAKRIGADVPFFIEGGRCFASGIGEILKPLPVKKEFYVIVYPGINISTKEAYARLTRIRRFSKIKKLENIFELAVFPLYPQLGKIKQELLDLGAKKALMSGSGSSVFGVFGDYSKAEKASRKIKKAGRKVWLARSLSADRRASWRLLK